MVEEFPKQQLRWSEIKGFIGPFSLLLLLQQPHCAVVEWLCTSAALRGAETEHLRRNENVGHNRRWLNNPRPVSPSLSFPASVCVSVNISRHVGECVL